MNAPTTLAAEPASRPVTTDETWPSRLTRSIADQIHHHRKQRKWSAQRLSDGCANLGLDFPRSTLADLENGRRRSISVAELLVVATALEIEPADLLPPGDVATWFRDAPDAAAEAVTALRRDVTPALMAILSNVAELSRLLEPERATRSSVTVANPATAQTPGHQAGPT